MQLCWNRKGAPRYGGGMPTITMRDAPVTTLAQIRAFLQLDRSFQFSIEDKQQRYVWIEEAVRKFGYHSLKKKKERTQVRRYIRRVTGLSNGQLTRLITRHKKTGRLRLNYGTLKRNGFRIIYGPKDIALLITTDTLHHHLNGKATQKILEREYEIFGRKEYENISRISPSWIYHIRRHNRQYTSSSAKWIATTKAASVDIGTRAKPRPEGKPGFLRIDTVHSGDLNGVKGAYHINIVDEVTQWEMVATVQAISEQFLKPVIEELISCFPFVIHEFHSDNGSEFVNHVVAQLLAKLYIRFTKSRARHSNDNALVESKNGSVVRRLYGHRHIPAHHATRINEFNRSFINLYLNYHRPCAVPETITDSRGKIKKKYILWMTPYEKFISLKDPGTYLKPQCSLADLERIASASSDNQFAQLMDDARKKLETSLQNI